ncbi:hypothetical protein V8E36_005336 [Tilletia maclaganii]
MQRVCKQALSSSREKSPTCDPRSPHQHDDTHLHRLPESAHQSSGCWSSTESVVEGERRSGAGRAQANGMPTMNMASSSAMETRVKDDAAQGRSLAQKRKANEYDLNGDANASTSSSSAPSGSSSKTMLQTSQQEIDVDASAALTLVELSTRTQNRRKPATKQQQPQLPTPTPAPGPTLVPQPEPRATKNSSSSSSTISRVDRERSWTYREELRGTIGQYYRGPLSPARVLELLADPSVSRHGRLCLSGASGGYLKYLHYLGPSITPAGRRRPNSYFKQLQATTEAGAAATASTSTSPAAGNGELQQGLVQAGAPNSFAPPDTTTTAEITPQTPTTTPQPQQPALREWWQCRLCHVDLHVPPNQVSNLGSHLFGTSRLGRPGCLDLRIDNPAEPVPAPLRDAQGVIVRTHPDKPRAALRAPRKGAAGGAVVDEASGSWSGGGSGVQAVGEQGQTPAAAVGSAA